ncbi:MAG TPA: hypothetical protein VGN76_06850 [Gemmatimonadales bacterium]|jgi:hypothetical protein|nr:hypothetical protein [Gemmatimonadales bacterium]
MTFTFKLARRNARFRNRASLLLLATLACNAEDRTSPSAPSTPMAPPVSGPVADSATVPTSGAAARGIPFGDFHLPTPRYRAPYTGALRALWPSGTIAELNAARASGFRIVVSLAGDRRGYTNSNGTFNLERWRNQINQYRRFNLQSYVADGTVIGHYLVDEPFCASCWGGRTIPASQVEEMARYSKSIWPNLPTIVRSPPSLLAQQNYRFLNVAWAQWEGPLHSPSYRMTPEQFRDRETAAAKARGLGLVFGMNYLDAGDGSSRIAGTYRNATSPRVNRWQMSAAEVKRVGSVFAAASYGCAVLSWKYSTSFLSRSGMSSALSQVSSLAKNRERSSCVR